MAKHYEIDRISELAEGDEDFIATLAAAFLEEVPIDAERLRVAIPAKDYKDAYQAAHKLKPTIDLFELSVYDELIEVQDWGKFEQTDKDVTQQLNKLLTAIDNTIEEIKKDFNL